jgi:hypothetical protein
MIEVTSSLLRRFWAKVDKSNLGGCWEWTASYASGYGSFSVPIDGKWRQRNANRISWLIHYSEIPDGLFVCHRCDNKKCVNPEHLFLGTPEDNMLDKMNKHRDYRHGTYVNSKVTADDVLKVFALREQGLTHQQIADQFSMSRPAITNILSRKTHQRVAR